MRGKRVDCQQPMNMCIPLQQRNTFLIHQPCDVIMIGRKQMQNHSSSQDIPEAHNAATIGVQCFAVSGLDNENTFTVVGCIRTIHLLDL